MGALGDRRRVGRVWIALCVAALTAGGATDGAAADASTHGGRARLANAPAQSATSRPLCVVGLRLRGSTRSGYTCWRHGHKRRPHCRPGSQLHRRGRGWVCLTTSTGSPAPQSSPPTTEAPAPSKPVPVPVATETFEQYLVNRAFEYAKWQGEQELAASLYTHVYYWKIEPGGCAMIGPKTAECVLLLYKELEVFSPEESVVVNRWAKAIFLLGVYYEYQGPELGYRARLGQIGDWSKGPWMWL
jgi:hypothetical protein